MSHFLEINVSVNNFLLDSLLVLGESSALFVFSMAFVPFSGSSDGAQPTLKQKEMRHMLYKWFLFLLTSEHNQNSSSFSRRGQLSAGCCSQL